jgi:hypothetical protein
LLARGDVSLTAVRLLGPHLTAENHGTVLESARCRRKAEIEEIARLSPRPDVPASIRRLPGPRVPPAPSNAGFSTSTTAGAAAPSAPGGTRHGADAGTPGGACAGTGPSDSAEASSRPLPSDPAGPPSLTARRSAEIKPLSPDRYRYQLTIGGATLEKLRLAKDMLRHALPSGDDEAVLDRALSALLRELARKKYGALETTRRPGRGDDVAAGVRVGSDAAPEADARPVPAPEREVSSGASGCRDHAPGPRPLPQRVHRPGRAPRRRAFVRDAGMRATGGERTTQSLHRRDRCSGRSGTGRSRAGRSGTDR